MKNPPRFADLLLELFCAPHLLEEVQGDLYERYVRDVRQLGVAKANQKYILNVLGFLRPFAIKRQSSEYSSPEYRTTFFLSPVMLRNYLKTAVRNLTKHRVSTLINLFGLTLGVTACLVIYVITNYELSYDTFHPDSERIYRLVGEAQFGPTGEKHPVGFPPNAVPLALRQEVSGIETIAAFHSVESDVLIPNGSQKPKRFESRRRTGGNADIIVAEPQYFDILKYEWLAGNPKTALNDPFKVVLSEQKAHKYFGDLPLEQILGKEVIYVDSVRVSVAGIVKDWSQPTDFTFTDFISFATIRASQLKREINLDQWNDIWSASQALVKLPKGVTPDQLAVPFQQFSRNHIQKEVKFEPGLQPLSDLHFNDDYQDNYSRKAHLPTLYGLMAVAGFILLIAAINFINLATAQSVQRAKEVGIRKVMGSSRKGLIIQFLSETALLTLVSVLIALALIKPILSVFQTLTPNGLTFDLLSAQTLLFLGIVVLTTSLLAGFYPSWVLSSYVPALTLKGQSALTGGQKGYLRKGLIIFQFAVSLVFIIGTLMVGRQLNFMRNKDLGFSTDAIIEVNTLRDDKSLVLAQKIKQLAGVERVAMQWFPVMGQSHMVTKLKYKGKKEVEMDVSAKIGDENFIPLYQLRFLAGRNYMKSDSLREMVINATYAKALGFKRPADAVNQFIDFQGKPYPIVGVVADFHEQSFHEKIGAVFLGYMPRQAKNIGVKLATKGGQLSDLKTTLSSIEQQWKEVYPDNKFDYTFLDESIAKLYEKEQKTAQLVNTATAIAILISCMGLFGLATFTAEQRTKEIGVRKVLGASVASIVGLLSKDFLKLVFIALVIASPIAWWAMNQWLKDFAYKIDLDWWVFALAGLMAITIALFTVGFQSIKAALVNPVKSLRSE
ncbi:ABC transporter permease [Spirosoma endophyticum]|uniref:ABC-type antimicrobial peptide transport system, permease component n=1 Tax=Spirosoma endophyticum TaxID=662367 RepID=A0A1I1GFY0_9BACT|nr:ABC transporter permease [Spirosoma endophyticum]SFC10444.1 ABC-type antimicrobial peptide transport system, permease component [Spirosoma endophyticum]